MDNNNKYSEYLIGFFDVLGFETLLEKLKLGGILEKYQQLIDIINKNNENHNRLKSLNMHGAFWVQDGIFELYEIRGAYASDSIIIWANRKLGGGVRFADGSFGHPNISSDNFLQICNELICSSIEIGLPLRGAVAMGEAFIDEENRIFLGSPFVDVARLEKRQIFIGASPCESFRNQTLNPMYLLPFKRHLKQLKENEKELTFGAVLDWPRHWRDSRKSDPSELIILLNTDKKFDKYYANALQLIEFSKKNDRYWEEAIK